MGESEVKTKAAAVEPSKPKKLRGEGGRFLPGLANPGHRDNRKETGAGGTKQIEVGGVFVPRQMAVADAVDQAFAQLDPVTWLVALARDKKTAHLFVQLLAKRMPTVIAGTGKNGAIDLQVEHVARRLAALPDDKLKGFAEFMSLIGVTDVLPAANETPALAAPAEKAASA